MFGFLIVRKSPALLHLFEAPPRNVAAPLVTRELTTDCSPGIITFPNLIRMMGFLGNDKVNRKVLWIKKITAAIMKEREDIKKSGARYRRSVTK